MRTTLAVLWRDLSSLPRRKRFYWKRIGVVTAGGAAMLWGLLAARGSVGMPMGLVIFTSLSMSSLVALTIISVTSACWTVMREKEARTLGMLFLTDISARGFVLGKLSTCMFSTTMVILAFLPIFMLAISLGGISMTQVLMAFAVLISTVFLCTGIGIMSSSVCNTAKRANSLASFVTVLWFIVTPVALSILATVAELYELWQTSLTALSPFVAMGHLNSGTVTLAMGTGCAINILLGSLCITLATGILPHRIVTKERPSLSHRARAKLKMLKKTRKWVIPARIRGNPVAWKDLHYYHGGARAAWTKCLVAVGLTILIALMIGHRLDSKPKDIFMVVIWLEFIFCMGVFMLGSVSHFGMAFTREKRLRTLENLLTSDLSQGDIVRGKILAAIQSLLPWLICLLLCSVGICVIMRDEYNFWETVIVFTLEAVSMWFAYSSLALWMSLKYKRAVAGPVCILLFLLYNSFGRAVSTSIMFLFAEVWLIVLIDVVLHGTVGAVFLIRTFSSLRKLAADFD